MQIFPHDETPQFPSSRFSSVRPANPVDAPVSASTLHISGRYPQTGFGYCAESHEFVHVAHGQGSVEVQGEGITKLSAGDVVYFLPGERIAWAGDMTLACFFSPPFDPAKHFLEGVRGEP